MIKGIKAVAFDIDGTLYPDWKLFLRMTFYVLSNLKFFLTFRAVRNELHKTAPLADFYEYQARLFAEKSHMTADVAKDKINEICYDGMRRFFLEVKPYPQVYETFAALKASGYKLALLSDFPPDQKGNVWGVRSLCDVCMGSEESGALKPSIYPYGILTQRLGVKPEEILYVGNSKKYDVRGASNAGMKTAYLMRGFRALFNKPLKEATVSFKNYKELRNIVLNG